MELDNKKESKKENKDININDENYHFSEYSCSSSDEDREFNKFLMDYASHRVNIENMSPGLITKLKNLGYLDRILNAQSNLSNKNDIEESKEVKYEISFRCYYDVMDDNSIQIINNGNSSYINQEIESKIKIIENNQKKDLIFKKKFDKIGINTVDFIIEKNLNNMKCIFLNCTALKKLNLLILIHQKYIF